MLKLDHITDKMAYFAQSPEKSEDRKSGKTEQKAGEQAAVLDLSADVQESRQKQYEEYKARLSEMETLMQQVEDNRTKKTQRSAISDRVKIMEVARRIARGAKVPPKDEKKLMEYSMELYMAVKNMAALCQDKDKKKYKSLWKDEEDGTSMELSAEQGAEPDGGNGAEIEDVYSGDL